MYLWSILFFFFFQMEYLHPDIWQQEDIMPRPWRDFKDWPAQLVQQWPNMQPQLAQRSANKQQPVQLMEEFSKLKKNKTKKHIHISKQAWKKKMKIEIKSKKKFLIKTLQHIHTPTTNRYCIIRKKGLLIHTYLLFFVLEKNDNNWKITIYYPYIA